MSYDLLSLSPAERALVARARAGDEAPLLEAARAGDGRALVALVLPYFRDLAHKRAGGRPSALTEDLVAVGIGAAFEALATFDPERGARFTTYAYPRTYAAITDEAARLASVIVADPSTVRAVSRAIRETRRPDAADDLDAAARLAHERDRITPETFRRVHATRTVEELPAFEPNGRTPVADEDDRAVTGVLAIPMPPMLGSAPDRLRAERRRRLVREALVELRTEERRVIELLDMRPEEQRPTVVEVAAELGVSRQTVTLRRRRGRDRLRELLGAPEVFETLFPPRRRAHLDPVTRAA